MINFAKKIEKLNKFLLKAITKAIEAGTKIITLYTGASDEIDKLKLLINKLVEIKKELENE